jgi:hypothetical protein
MAESRFEGAHFATAIKTARFDTMSENEAASLINVIFADFFPPKMRSFLNSGKSGFFPSFCVGNLNDLRFAIFSQMKLKSFAPSRFWTFWRMKSAVGQF